MSFADEIAEKRRAAASLKADQTKHTESLSAVTDSGKGVVNATSMLAKSEDISAVIKQLKEVQLTQLLTAQSAAIPKPDKPTVILTDQTDLGDRLTKLADNIAASVSKLDTTRVNADQLTALRDVQKALKDYTKSLTGNATADKKTSAELLSAIKAIKLAPVVNVPAPKVTVESPKVDLSPITDALERAYKPPEVDDSAIDLECYRAQDIDNSNKDMQYVGFVNPAGNWYIIENNVKGNSIRYVFGTDGYEQAFSKAATYSYSLLNEAINALSA